MLRRCAIVANGSAKKPGSTTYLATWKCHWKRLAQLTVVVAFRLLSGTTLTHHPAALSDEAQSGCPPRALQFIQLRR
jgi:hypothetical protein